MRLASEYQQQTKKTDTDDHESRKHIVRLGRGVPQPTNRKRGISLSKQRQKIEAESLGKHQISKEKMVEQLLSTPNPPPSKTNTQQIFTRAVYGTKNKVQHKDYAAEHLFVSPQITKPEFVREITRQLTASKSQQHFFISTPQNNFYRNPSNLQQNIHNFNIPNNCYIPTKQLASTGFRKAQESQIRSIRESSKIRFISPPSLAIQLPQSKLHSSSPISAIKFIELKETEKQTLKSAVECTSIPTAKKIPFTFEHNHLQSTKQMATNYRKQDPYSLLSSKRTKKVEQSEQEISESDQLTKTKKPLHRLTQCKQVSSSSSVSIESRCQKLEGKGIRSLWDANKAESIISMKESQQIKVEQSQVMIDYFDPKHSLSRKK